MRKSRLIVLVDFSPSCACFLRFAYDWSKSIGAQVLLVHSAPALVPAMTDEDAKQEIERVTTDDALVKLKALVETALPEDAPVSFHVSHEKVLKVLRELLQEPLDNLIFLGLKGTGMLKKIFIGSTAVDVVDNIDNPVVLLPKSEKQYSCESLLVAVQRENPLNVVAFNNVLKFAGHELERITFISLVDESLEEFEQTEKYLNELAEHYSERVTTCYEIYKSDAIFEDLKAIVAKKELQFLVVQRGSRMLTDQLFRPFLINELAYEGETPLIVIP